MKRRIVARVSLCFMSTVTLLAFSDINKISSATLFKETGLAGISLSLDKYYSGSVENVKANTSQATVMSLNEAEILGQSDIRATGSLAQLGPMDVMPAPAAQTLIPAEQTPVPVEQTSAPVEQTPAPTEQTPSPVSKYENVGISIANDYVNIREKADTESKILGKLYKGSAATILETDGEWVKIKSGKVEGYINKEFLAIGFSAEELVDKYGTKWAKVSTTTLKVREDRNIESTVLTLIPIDEKYEIIKEYDEWVEILIDEGDENNDTKGFVSKEFVNIEVEFEHAISVEEEQAKIKAAEEARKAEEEAAAKLRRQKEAEQAAANNSNRNSRDKSNNRSNGSSHNRSDNGSSHNRSDNSSSHNRSDSHNSSGSDNSSNDRTPVSGRSTGSGSEIASFGIKFVGNPYVWGGTSLTSGADCSGFVPTIFRNFGGSLPRTAAAQSGVGTRIDVSNAKAGDLIFYGSNGSISHVALCIGGGQVVHASNKKTGIKISNVLYRTPYCARRVVN